MRTHPLESVRARINDFRAVFSIPAFAIYQLGNIGMTTGFWMQRIAVGWVTWELTGSEYWLGLVAFAELFPSILTAIYGGIIVDKRPAPFVMFWGQIASGALALAMALMAMTGALTPWAIVWSMVALGAISGVLLPARLVMASHLAPKSLLPQALAVNSTGFNLSRFIGPAVAAGLLLVGPVGIIFLIAAAGFGGLAVALYQVMDIPPQNPRPAASAPVNMGVVVRELVLIPIVLGVILIQAVQGILVRPASELFPAFADLAFGRGASGLGLLNAALGIGAVVGALLLSKSRAPQAAIRQILAMSAVFGLSLMAFAMTTNFWLALGILLVHGAAMSASNISALAYVQTEAPPDRLGRILSLYTIVFRVGPAIGAFLFGMSAEATNLMITGVGFSVLGLAATAVLASYIYKHLREYDHDAIR